jgi:hypothetical protein
MSRTFEMRTNQAKQNCIEVISKIECSLDQQLVVEIKEKNRNLEQNAKLHALFEDAARTCTWMGQKRDALAWKVLFISAHSIEEKRPVEMIPGLCGEFVNIRESSAKMSVKRMSSLIEYVTAWIAHNGE